FYVEQKAAQIQKKLEELAVEQEQNATEEVENTKVKNQQQIEKEFENLKQDFNDLNKKNDDLKRPMDFPDTKTEQDQLTEQLKQISEELQNLKTDKSKTQQKQKSASVKMKQLSEKLERSMQSMQGEEIEENIDDLRKIVENLITFSFEQEELQESFSASTNASANYPQHIKNQQKLKQYFEHIDDSLYMLSLRVVQISSFVQNEVEKVHFNIDESLKNFTDNQIGMGIANQQYTITSTNNLANKLSDLLENLLNASAKMGKSSDGNKSGFSLPDIIKKQETLSQKIGEQINKEGNKSSGNSDEESNETLFQMYQEQAKLRETLEQLLQQKTGNNDANAVKKMEEIEQELINKGFSEELITKIKQLNYQLLKLEEAKLEQGFDAKRKAEENKTLYTQKKIRELEFKKKIKNNTEILNRQSLPLRTIYKKRVQEYFKNQ
ncbi:MAG TPA: hypothetical protein VJ970_04475, partial [Flavobacteriaceae bacterium]|nr:hypothetical protein [Flavobacteriaceae bacterium]